MKFQILLLAIFILSFQAKREFPEIGIMSAPFTPMEQDGININYKVVSQQADFQKQVGVNTVWICGGMADFTRYSIEQRKKLSEEWVKHAQRHNLYTIVHIGSNVLEETLELARHAQIIGADAFGVVPPFYHTLKSEHDVVQWLLQQQKAAPKLDIFYYHIPGSSRTNIKIRKLLELAHKEGLTNFKGVKYVSEDAWDFLECVRDFPHIKMMWAAEPKLRGFPLGATHAVLAEDFYAQTYIRMFNYYKNGDINKAQEEQLWKKQTDGIFGKYSQSKRTVYKKLAGFDLGPPTFPEAALSEQDQKEMDKELEEKTKFFKNVYPAKNQDEEVEYKNFL